MLSGRISMYTDPKSSEVRLVHLGRAVEGLQKAHN